MIDAIIYICYGLFVFFVVSLIIDAFRQVLLNGMSWKEFSDYIDKKYYS